MTFTLDNQRKTGLLSPTIGSTSKSGLEITTPFYWNIAPDMDATIAPRYMAKRGTQWGGEYRYLGQSYSGKIAGEYLENDQITHTNRNALTIVHNQDFGYGFTGALNLNGVSDDTYFTDLSTRLSNVTQTNLLREGRINYGGGGWWSASLMAQRFQTLQDPSLPPVAIPYDRLPQLLVNADRADLPLGTEGIFSGEYVDFSNPTGTAVEGKRTTLYPQLAYPIQTALFYVTPKVGFHSTRYELVQQAAGVPDQITRNVPIFSIDSGTVFERQLQLFDQDLTQTLEPRAYYLRVPKRDQSQIPLFDTGVADFNFAQIFSENSYSGGDRISDANQLTLAVTSRLIDTESGEEMVRAAVGQRYYFADQTVTIPGVAARTGHIADFLAALSGKVNRELSIDTGMQYNYQDKQVERLNVGGSYQPEAGKVFNAGYRYTRSLLRQIDTSAQWPLFGGWHAVGRYNYSLRDKRIVESIAGLEYDGGCWATRFVVQRLATAVGQVNNSIFVQLELSGFSDIGSNPLDVLKRNIPGYGRITQPTADRVFAE
jgi:LPS-assembly protein